MSAWGRRVPLRQTGRQAYLESGGLRQLGKLWDSAMFKNIWISLICCDSRKAKRRTMLRLDQANLSKCKGESVVRNKKNIV